MNRSLLNYRTNNNLSVEQMAQVVEQTPARYRVIETCVETMPSTWLSRIIRKLKPNQTQVAQLATMMTEYGKARPRNQRANIIQDLCRRTGFSQGDVANKLRVSQGYVSAMANGRRRLTQEHFAALVSFFLTNEYETFQLLKLMGSAKGGEHA